MSRLDLARAFAYKYLAERIEKRKPEYLAYPDAAEYMLAMNIILKMGEDRQATPEEFQAALILEEVIAIEGCLSVGSDKEIHEGETETMLVILTNRLDKKINVLKELEFDNVKSHVARSGGIAKAKNSPIATAKKEITDRYNAKKHIFAIRDHSAKFVREMYVEYHTVITSVKTIERLVAELNKANELITSKNK